MKAQIFLAALLFFDATFVLSCSKLPTNSNRSADRSPDVAVSANSTSAPASPTVDNNETYSIALNDFNSRNYVKAVEGFKLAISADPNNADAHFYLARSYRALKRDDDAVGSFKEAVRLKPDHADANFELGNIYFVRKNYGSSLPYFEQAAKVKYTSPEMLMALAENQRLLKQYDRAIVQYGKVIGFEPNNAYAYYGLGLTYIGLNNRIAAQQQVRKLESLNKELAKKLAEQLGG
jgi:tetratricopeptide (TPR) repeat protein